MTTLNNEDPADPSVHEPKIIGAPEVVWLVYGKPDRPVTHAECLMAGDVGWNEQEQFDTDVPYVRGDLALAAAEGGKALMLTGHFASDWRLLPKLRGMLLDTLRREYPAGCPVTVVNARRDYRGEVVSWNADNATLLIRSDRDEGVSWHPLADVHRVGPPPVKPSHCTTWEACRASYCPGKCLPPPIPKT